MITQTQPTATALRCYDNCRHWWQERLAGHTLEPVIWKDDRTFFLRTPVLYNTILNLEQLGFIEHKYQGNLKKLHGPTAISTYRETVGRYGVQLTIHLSDGHTPPLVEMDFDYWNPWDVVGIIGHAKEVLINKWRNIRTDPFKVAKARGWLK